MPIPPSAYRCQSHCPHTAPVSAYPVSQTRSLRSLQSLPQPRASTLPLNRISPFGKGISRQKTTGSGHPSPQPPAKHRAGGCTLGTLGRGAVIPDGQGVGGSQAFLSGGRGKMPLSPDQFFGLRRERPAENREGGAPLVPVGGVRFSGAVMVLGAQPF